MMQASHQGRMDKLSNHNFPSNQSGKNFVQNVSSGFSSDPRHRQMNSDIFKNSNVPQSAKDG